MHFFSSSALACIKFTLQRHVCFYLLWPVLGREKSAKPSSLCSTAVSCKFCPSLCFERQKVKPPWLSAQNPWSFSRVKNEPPFSFCSLYLNSLHEHEWMDSASGFRLVRRSYISHWRQGGKGAESQIKPPKSKLGNGLTNDYLHAR